MWTFCMEAPVASASYRFCRRIQQDPPRILYGSCNPSNAASRSHCVQPGLLLRSKPASWCLDFDGGEDCHLLTNHFWGDGDGPPADQIGTALAKAELHWATIGILQRSCVVAKQATVTFAASKPDVLLDLLLR